MASGKKGKRIKKRLGRALRWALVLLLILAFGFSVYCALSGFDPVAAISSGLAEPSPSPISTASPSPSPQQGGNLRAYFLDVGQGDCALLISPSGRTMLVDSGESTAFSTVYSFLTGLGIERLDAIVASHPHSDHIGGMAELIRAFDVGAMYMPEADVMSGVYDDMMLALEQKSVDITYVSAESAPQVGWDEDVTIEVLSPFEDIAYKDLNDYSIIMRVRYGDTSILFTGDAEGSTPQSAEYAALSRFTSDRFESTVLKVGHHGSFTSTSDAFLQAVSPEYAVISAGEGNEYGHPSASVLSRLEAQGTKIFRTDQQGHILAELDGERAALSPVKAPSQSFGGIARDIWGSVKELWQSFISIFK